MKKNLILWVVIIAGLQTAAAQQPAAPLNPFPGSIQRQAPTPTNFLGSPRTGTNSTVNPTNGFPVPTNAMPTPTNFFPSQPNAGTTNFVPVPGNNYIATPEGIATAPTNNSGATTPQPGVRSTTTPVPPSPGHQTPPPPARRITPH